MKKFIAVVMGLTLALAYGYAFADNSGMTAKDMNGTLYNGITYFGPERSVQCSDIGGSAAGGMVASDKESAVDIKDKLTFIGGDKTDPLLRCAWVVEKPAVHNGLTAVDGLR